jgi:hypothetical protein
MKAIVGLLPAAQKRKSFRSFLCLAACLTFNSVLAHAGVTYTCDASIDATQAGTCAYLNSTVAGYYSSTFSNANANIYIQMGITGLGSSQTALDALTYSQYQSALITDSSGDIVDSGATASLPGTEPSIYGGDGIAVTSALGSALCTSVGATVCTADGLDTLAGVTSTGAGCTLGTAGCYNAVVTITTPANLSGETGGTQFLYWDQTGGSIPADAYDFYTVVQHETDEVLGTASCISTSGSLSDGCGSFASAVDLFRYQAPGTRVFIDTTPGAYFSYNGGLTNGAAGAPYNTLANGDDYADFATNCAHVQDATGCLGQIFNITDDGGAEVNILDAVGFNLNLTPEPATMTMFIVGFAAMLARFRRKKA